MNDCRADKIATGHTADDQAETLLMRLIRGAGSEGLAGIRPVRENHVIRPLIEASRREVMAYLNRNGLPFRTDASNATADVTRNRIRQELLPLLEKKFNPEIVSTLTNIGDILREESVFLDHETERILEEIPVERGTERLRFPVSAVKDLPVAIQRRLIRRLIEKTGGEAERLTFAHIERTRRLIQTGETGQRLDIPGDIHLERRRGVLFLRKGLATPFCVAIPAPGTGYIVAGRRITALMVDTSGIPEPMPSCCACFDADGIEFPLTARSREPGDRLNVSGMTGTRSIKELFNEWDIPLLERDEILLITDRKNTLWVAGRRRSRVAPVTESTRRALLIRVE
jgi:tRNA(Ile)-lysidine synthase